MSFKFYVIFDVNSSLNVYYVFIFNVVCIYKYYFQCLVLNCLNYSFILVICIIVCDNNYFQQFLIIFGRVIDNWVYRDNIIWFFFIIFL